MPRITIPANGWRPRDYQMPAWAAWERGIKRTALNWHRRAGKDELSLHKAAVAAHLRPANYWHCLPLFTQARKAIWEAVNPHTGKKRIDEAFPRELRSRTDNTSMTIEFKSGAVWRVVGSDNPDSLVGAPPAGIVFSEFALSNKSAWAYLAPILEENGGWADFISTPRGKNHWHDLYQEVKNDPEWFVETLTVDDTHAISLESVEKARKNYHALFGEQAGDALIRQEYYCSFTAAILGAYWGKEMEDAERSGRIGMVPPMPGAPVHTAWDLGIRDSMVIWYWQAVPSAAGQGRVRVLGCYSAMNYGIMHYAKVIQDRALLQGYVRGQDFLPHDARQREMGSWDEDTHKAKQRIEVMLECGLKPKIVTDHALMDGISAVRQVLPRCHFDAAACGNTALEAMRQYQTEWDDDKKIFSDRPLHDWSSHYADAFRTLAMAYREIVPREVPVPGPMVTIGDEGLAALPPRVRGVTLNDLWNAQPRRGRR